METEKKCFRLRNREKIPPSIRIEYAISVLVWKLPKIAFARPESRFAFGGRKVCFIAIFNVCHFMFSFFVIFKLKLLTLLLPQSMNGLFLGSGRWKMLFNMLSPHPKSIFWACTILFSLGAQKSWKFVFAARIDCETCCLSFALAPPHPTAVFVRLRKTWLKSEHPNWNKWSH